MSRQKSVAFYTLGCKLNFSESSGYAKSCEEAGMRVVDFGESADIYVINTCSVTNEADKKCRQIVRRAHRQSPKAQVVVLGCYAQLKPEEIASISGVDLVLGAKEKFQLVDYLSELSLNNDRTLIASTEIEKADTFSPSYSIGDRTRSFLKIQDGCDYSCAFCTIPLARGKSRSGSIEEIVADAQKLSELGTKEIVLTGVNIGDFGYRGAGKERGSFYELIKALDRVKGIERYRISSIEPNLCYDEIIEFVANSKKFVPHFHMPLQSGNNKQLAAMRRRYKRELYAQRVEKIKELMPHACIGVDVIVGFPGESEEDFKESYRFVKDLDISYLHVFTYSERNDTVASEMGDIVPKQVRKERNSMLRILSEKKKRRFYLQFVGRSMNVLCEQDKEDGMLSGFTRNYLKVSFPGDSSMVNTIQKMYLTEVNEENIFLAEPRSEILEKSHSVV